MSQTLRDRIGRDSLAAVDFAARGMVKQLKSPSGASNISRRLELTNAQARPLSDADVVSIREFHRLAGQGDAEIDTKAIMWAVESMLLGEFNALYFPPCNGYTLASIDATYTGQLDINNPPGPIALLSDDPRCCMIRSGNGCPQNPFVVRNTVHGVVIQGIGREVTADPISYQHGISIMNASNVLIDNCYSLGAQGYGIGLTEDVAAAPALRTIAPMNRIVVRRTHIENASQYGINHFPKMLSNDALFEELRVINCGRNTQGVVGHSGLKVGQVTTNTHLHDIYIEGANGSTCLEIGNYETLTYDGIRIYTASCQAISISAGTHASLLTRFPETAGGATPAPYLPSHASIRGKELVVKHDASVAGLRRTPIGTMQIGRSVIGWSAGVPVPVVTAATTNVALTGLYAINGVTPTAGQRVLTTAQTNGADNDLWEAAVGAWSRVNPLASDGTAQTIGEDSVIDVFGGTAQGGWILATAGVINRGVTVQNWQPFRPGPISIEIDTEGDVIDTSEYATRSFVGTFEGKSGIRLKDFSIAMRHKYGNTADLGGTAALPERGLYLDYSLGGRITDPKVSLELVNPFKIAQAVLRGIEFIGVDGATIQKLYLENMGTNAVLFNNCIGSFSAPALKVRNYNLTGVGSAGMISISGGSATYDFPNAEYIQDTGVGDGYYWILGGGTSPIRLLDRRATNAGLLVSVAPMIVSIGPRWGNSTMVAGTATVTFAHPEPNATYSIQLTPNSDATAWVSGTPTASGFTINCSDATGVVRWAIIPS